MRGLDKHAALMSVTTRRCATALAVAVGVGLEVTYAQAAPVLLAQYKVSGYNATTGVWTDSSANTYDATSAGLTKPTIVTNVTPNGSSAVNFAGAQYLSIGNSGISSPSATGYTIFAYLSVDASQGQRGIVGASRAAAAYGSGPAYSLDVGSSQSFQQHTYRTWQPSNGPTGATGHPTDEFVNINVATTSNGSTFRFDGALDTGTAAGMYYDSAAYPLISLGAAMPDGTASFVGKIAEVRIYSGVLSDADRQTIEGELQAAYVPEPGTLGLLAMGGLGLLARRRRLA